jgi:hypothetical protein
MVTKEEESWDYFIKHRACKLHLHPMLFFNRGEGVWHCFCGKNTMAPVDPATRNIPIPLEIFDEN